MGNCRWTKRQAFKGHWSAIIAFYYPNLDEWGKQSCQTAPVNNGYQCLWQLSHLGARPHGRC